MNYLVDSIQNLTKNMNSNEWIQYENIKILWFNDNEFKGQFYG